MKLTAGRVISALALLVFVFFVLEGWVPMFLAHEVHSAGGTPVKSSHYRATGSINFLPGPASESLSDIRCLSNFASTACAGLYPSLQQTANTLYFVWPSGCYTKPAPGPDIAYQGFNLEFFAATRTLVIHCYAGTGWWHASTGVYGMSSVEYLLLAISTSGIGAGPIEIHEDDRQEHLIGEESAEWKLTTATIT